MGFLSGSIFSAVLVVGVVLYPPALGIIGLSAVGPVAGGAFAATQAGLAGGIAAGTWMAAGQAVAMSFAAPLP